MATAPTPFFPTTVVPPPPCGCGAPPYAPCSFPPTAAYPSPSFPGGYYTSPFPFYNNPPAFPYAATYPHPASMYTPTFPSPAGSSPNWPPPAPDPTPSTAPFPSPSKDDCTYFPLAVAAEDPSSKLVDAKLPPGHMLSPSEMPNPSLFVDRTCDSTPAGRVLPELHATKPPARRKTSVLKARTSRESRASSHRTTWASSSTACPPTQSSKAVTGGTPINSKTEEDDDATPLYGRDFQTEKINIAVHPAFPNFRCQGSDLTKGNNTSGASISGVHKHTGPKILSMELAEAQFSSAATNASNFYDTGTTASLSESSLSSPSDALATAYVAPKMFDEMPTPQSGYENCCSGHQNPIQSSYVHGGKTNLREKYIDEVPQSYGFSNLINRSVSLADGTKHCYYALPEDYPLQLASPPMSTSTEGKIGVTAPFSVAAGLAPVLCSKANTDGSQPMLTENQQLSMTGQDLSKIPETYPFVRATPQPLFDDYGEEIDGCSNEFVDIFAGIPEQQEYEEEQHRNSQALKRFSKAMFSSERLTVDTVVVFSLATGQKPDTELCGNHVKQQVNSRNMPITEAGRKEWDPGTVQIIMDVPAVVKWSSLEGLIHAVNLSPNILLSRTVYAATTFPNILVSVPLSVQWDPGTSAYRHSSNANLCNQVGTYEISIDLGFTVSGDTVAIDCCNLPTNTIFSAMLLVEVLYYSQGHGVENRETMQWDPGVKISFYSCLDFLTVWSETDTSLSCTHIPDLASWPNQPVSCAVCICDPGIGISSPMYHWLPSLTAATKKPLSSLQTPEPATWLSLVNNASYAWDPGTLLIQNKSVLLLLFTEEKEMVTLIIDNWKFRSQQSVKTNYPAKNLLSLHNYLQIWEMDIMLITFLPP